MNFRDLNAIKANRKDCRYQNSMTVRDMNFRSRPEIAEESETEPEAVKPVPEMTQPKNTVPPVRSYPNQIVYSQTISPQSMSVQMGYTNISGFPPTAIPPEFQQSQHMRYPQSAYYAPKSVPPVPEKPQGQFLYYTQNNNNPAPVPVPSVEKPARPAPPVPPPRPPEPEKPDPSKFIEEPTPTPTPKMVAPAPVRKKTDDFNMDFGAFGGTFDGDPDQSTPVADIPVMNIDDYKL
ncbi:MAG: hypothetical protein NC177_11795 [Ruminococcus flavefaciens]|nr:hypothetical protein [Ruminococcus flavefaciens]